MTCRCPGVARRHPPGAALAGSPPADAARQVRPPAPPCVRTARASRLRGLRGRASLLFTIDFVLRLDRAPGAGQFLLCPQDFRGRANFGALDRDGGVGIQLFKISGRRLNSAKNAAHSTRSALAPGLVLGCSFIADPRAPRPSSACAMAACRASAITRWRSAIWASSRGAWRSRPAWAVSSSHCESARKSFAVRFSGSGHPVIWVCGQAGVG
jgi:hypothetical protein